MTTETIDDLAGPLEGNSNAIEPTRADWLALVEEYAKLEAPAYIITEDGEKIAAVDAEKRLSQAKKLLKAHMLATGETFDYEGRGTLVCREEPFGYWWAVNDLFADDPAAFYRLLELRALKVDDAQVEQSVKRGDFVVPAQFRHRGTRTVMRWAR